VKPTPQHRRLTHEDMRVTPTLEGTVERVSGFCWICDSWVTNTWMLHYRPMNGSGRWGYCECRHLREQDVLAPRRS
jgi:hypothetical protein